MYAVIDLGSNSFHLLIAQYSNGSFALVDRCSEKIQLAEGLNAQGTLSAAAMKRGLDCLTLFKQILARHPIREQRVVATQALRQASNAGDFIAQAKTLGFNIEIISGTHEAELIFRGISDPLPPIEGNRLVIDIGGASTEIAVGNEEEILFAHSLPMGCVCWRDGFFADGIEYRQRGAQAKAAAREILEPCLDQLQSLQWSETFASSGSAKMLSRISLRNNWSQGDISRACVQHIEAALADLAHYSDIRLRGLKPERQDLLAPGISIMATLMDALDISTVHYSSTALREGILGEMAGRRVSYQIDDEGARLLGT